MPPNHRETRSLAAETIQILNYLKLPSGEKLHRLNPFDIGEFRLYEFEGKLHFLKYQKGKNVDGGFNKNFHNYDVLFILQSGRQVVTS